MAVDERDREAIILQTKERVTSRYALQEADKHFGRRRSDGRVYTIISRSLHERLVDLQANEQAALSLRDELALHRAIMQEVVDNYGKACDMRDALIESNADDKLISQAKLVVDNYANEMRESLAFVQKCAVDAAAVEARAGNSFSLNAVRSIMTQISNIMFDLCGEENKALAIEFERRISEDVKVAVIETGTALTPDMDVRAMDAMIPRVDE